MCEKIVNDLLYEVFLKIANTFINDEKWGRYMRKTCFFFGLNFTAGLMLRFDKIIISPAPGLEYTELKG